MAAANFQGFEITMHDPGIALITFNQPDTLNAFTHRCKRDLVETLTQFQMDDTVRVVVFTGAGKAFIAGDNISESLPEFKASKARVGEIPRGHHNALGTYNGLRALSQPVNTAIRSLDKLTIAAINGYAIQTGLSLALACDFRLASPKAKLGSATLRFGLLPDEGGQYLLLQYLGLARTMDFLMRNRIVSATEARDLGLVHEIIDAEHLLPHAIDLARELANGPQAAMRMLKRSIYNAAELTFSQALDEIASKTAVTDHHPDAVEGIKAFNEKRTPTFNRWLEQD